MATEIIWDTVEDSSAEAFGIIKRHARGALITGLDTSVTPADMLWSVLSLPGVPVTGQSHPTRPELKYNRVLLRGVSGDSVRAQFIYETFNPSGPASAYYITHDSFTQSFQTNMVPGTRVPIRVSYEDPVTGLKIPEDYVTFTFDRTMKAISVTALIYGNPEGSTDGAYVNRANDSAWQGLPIGYWRTLRYKTSYAKFSGYYQKEMTALTKVDEDWSEMGILRNSVTGRFAKVLESNITACLSATYAYGIQPGTSTLGFVRVGPYRTANFASIFGFG